MALIDIITDDVINAADVLALIRAPGGRLTLESGVPVSITDQLAKSTLYYTPYLHNTIQLFTGTIWQLLSFSEVSLNISSFTSGKPYDIFAYNDSGNVTLEGLVWTNDTTRATALAMQDGVLVKSGDTTRRYLGSIYTSASGKCEDSYAQRLVFNYYNRVFRHITGTLISSASHTYTTTTTRAWNNLTTVGSYRLNFLIGVVEDLVQLTGWFRLSSTSTGQSGQVGIGLNSTSGMIIYGLKFAPAVNGVTLDVNNSGFALPGIGLNFAQLLEYGAAASITYVTSHLSGLIKQ